MLVTGFFCLSSLAMTEDVLNANFFLPTLENFEMYSPARSKSSAGASFFRLLPSPERGLVHQTLFRPSPRLKVGFRIPNG